MNNLKQKKQNKQSGFTLIELVVAITILSILSVIGYKAFSAAIATRQSIEKHSDMLRDFELGLFILQNDFEQMQTDPIPSGTIAFIGNKIRINANKTTGLTMSGSNSDASMANLALNKNNSSKALFTFYRSENPAINVGISRISYYFKNGQLIQQQTYLSNPNLFTQNLGKKSSNNSITNTNINTSSGEKLKYNQLSSDSNTADSNTSGSTNTNLSLNNNANLSNGYSANETVIMKHITSLEVNYYTKSGKKYDVWTQNLIPAQIEIIFNHERYGKIIFKQLLNQ